MKKLSALSAGLALMTTGLISCNKDDCNDNTIYNVSFFTPENQGAHTLYIDNIEKGTLNYFATAPQCGQLSNEGSQPLKLQLPAGTYFISARNGQGQVTTSANITISKTITRVAGEMGGTSVSSEESCVVIGLWE